MLSYRHAFHAGNHGDVLKHAVLTRILTYMVGKDRPLLYLDTHAGAGHYELQQGMAYKTQEANAGIKQLWDAEAPPAMLQPYLQTLRDYNPNGMLRLYPGSPLLAQHLLRPVDRAVCFELHSTDGPLLLDVVRADSRFVVASTDGLAGLRAQLPPKERRSVVLVDPSYEQDADYLAIAAAIKEAVRRFPTGVYMIWYPLLLNSPATRLLRALTALPTAKTLRVEITVTTPVGPGLLGSGLWIINPPWVVQAELHAALPWLAHRLGGATATWVLDATA